MSGVLVDDGVGVFPVLVGRTDDSGVGLVGGETGGDTGGLTGGDTGGLVGGEVGGLVGGEVGGLVGGEVGGDVGGLVGGGLCWVSPEATSAADAAVLIAWTVGMVQSNAPPTRVPLRKAARRVTPRLTSSLIVSVPTLDHVPT